MHPNDLKLLIYVFDCLRHHRRFWIVWTPDGWIVL